MAGPQTITVRITLTLPKVTLSSYEAEAKEKGGTLESVLTARLTSCVDHTSSKPLYFTDDQRQQIQRLLGIGFSTPEEVINAVTRLNAVKISDCEVTLKEPLLWRLKSRCFGKSFKDFMQQTLVEQLEQYCGMR